MTMTQQAVQFRKHRYPALNSFLLLTAGICRRPSDWSECSPPVQRCSLDTECVKDQKCCDDGCAGTQCQTPGKDRN